MNDPGEDFFHEVEGQQRRDRPSVGGATRRARRHAAPGSRQRPPVRAAGTLIMGLIGLTLASFGTGEVVEASPATRADLHLLTAIANHRADVLTTALRAASEVGGGPGVTLTVMAVASALVWGTHRWSSAVLGLVAVAGAELVKASAKQLVARPRPPLEWVVPGAASGGFAFPSGHATVAAAGYGAVALMLMAVVRRQLLRAMVVVGAALGIVTVGFSRLYLGAHWGSDVLAGWTLGLTWLAIVARSLKFPVRPARS